MSNLDFSILLPYAGLLPSALKITMIIGLCGFGLAVIISTVVGSLRSKKLPKPLSFILTAYVEFFRGTPLLVQVFVVYYGIPAFGIKIDPMVAAIITMGLNSGAYLSENIRAAIMSVDKGQYEAAELLGYSPLQTTIHIVIPQAMRIVIPAFMNGFSSMVKETSIISVLPVIELTKLGNQVYAKTFHPFEIYITLAVIYFILTYFITFLAKWLERRLSTWAK